jgi:hypothetical protein
MAQDMAECSTLYTQFRLRFGLEIGKQVEARHEERRNILSDLETVRLELYILVGHGRFVIVTGPRSIVSGYGEMELPLVLVCMEYSKLDREATIILPALGPTFPNRTGPIRLPHDVSFAVHAAVANFAGAQLYNIDPRIYEHYIVFRDGSNGWDGD